MGEKNPRYVQAWFGSYAEVQGLPKSMQRVVQNALKTQQHDPGRFLASMGRILRFCDIGTLCRSRSRLAAAVLLEDQAQVSMAAMHARSLALHFSRAFRSLRYEPRTGASSSALEIILARDDLESMRQAVRRGVPIPAAVDDPGLKQTHDEIRSEIEDGIQTIDALHDDVLGGLIGHHLAYLAPDIAEEYLWELVPVEPVCWWLAIWWQNRRRDPIPR
jgi:hypothetical protein